jgi:hypothetical protein
VAEDRLDGLVEFGEAGNGAAAEGGEGFGEADGLDGVGGRGVEALFTEESGDADHPVGGEVAGRAGVGMFPEEVVVTGGGHAGAVTAFGGKPAVGPGSPGDLDGGARESGEEFAIAGGGGPIGEGGHMPGAADDGDALEALLVGGAQGLAHPGFPPGLAEGVVRMAGRRHFRPERGHGFRNGGEQAGTVLALFDQAFPPFLAVVESGGAGEPGERVALEGEGFGFVVGGRGGRGGSCGFGSGRWSFAGSRRVGGRGGFGRSVGGRRGWLGRRDKLVPLGQIHEAGGDPARDGVADGLPFRGEGGEGEEGGAAGIVHRVHQQGDGRLHRRIGGEREKGVGLGRSLDEEAIRAVPFEFGEEQAGAAGSVVPDAEQVEGWGNGSHYSTSRAAR